MSSESPQVGSSEWIKQTTETSATFIRWLAELIQGRNWFMLLVVIGVLLTLSSVFLRDTLNRWLPEDHQDSIWGTVTVAIVLAFMAALVVAVVTQPRALSFTMAELAERKAIKGLRAFGKEDAEIFTRLQRDRKLRACLEILTADTFGFVTLMGESGCGKTSFLQAGVWSRLSMPEASHQAVYVRLSERPPLEAIQQAIAAQLEVPLDWLQPSSTPAASLYEMLNQAVEAAGKPIVLLLDQFEQFFVQFPREQDRADFIQALATWYHPPCPITAQVLVSIRADLSWRLHEIQQTLGYTLGNDNCIQLDKFSPQDAAQVLVVIAETENLACDRRFITELAEQELASPKDGLISPVDVQILAWMIERQTAEELRAFNRQAFQKFGGVEGLLTRFLQRTLDTLPLPSQRQVAVKVLLALTDQEQQVRAGVQTVAELQDRLKADAKPPEVREALKWLASSGVRLITPVERQEEDGYELAHERLIPALMRQAGKELTAVDKANQLLDRRVNEWLGNQRHPYYWLRWQELNLLQRHQAYLVWGTREPQKRQLLHLSQRRRTRRLSAIGLVALIFSLFIGWLFYIPQGQIQLIRWGIDVTVANVSSELVTPAALAIGKDGNWPKAFRLERRLVHQDSATADFLKSVMDVVPRLQEGQQRTVMAQAAITAERITDPKLRVEVLIAIAQAYDHLNSATAAAELLRQAITTVEDISEPGSKADALRAIAQAYGELDDATVAAELLRQAITAVEDISEPGSKADALRAIVQAISQLDDASTAAELLRQAITTAEDISSTGLQSNVLIAIVQAISQLDDAPAAAELLRQVITAVGDISEPRSKPDVLIAIAQAYGELDDAPAAAELLRQAITAVEDISDPDSKPNVLIAIAQAYGELDDAPAAAELLRQAIAAAEDISAPWSKANALRAIAQAYGELDDAPAAAELLRQAIAAAEDISNPWSKANALRAIAQAYGELDDAPAAAELLLQAIAAVEDISEPGSKDYTLGAIAQVSEKLGNTYIGQEVLTAMITPSSYHLNIPAFFSGRLGQLDQEGEDTLRQIRQKAKQVREYQATSNLAISYARLGKWDHALGTLLSGVGWFSPWALADILTPWTEAHNPNLIAGAVVLAANSDEPTNNGIQLVVDIKSPDTDCDQHADWWEVVSKEGELLYRQLIPDVHGYERSFSLTSDPITMPLTQPVVIRAHLHQPRQELNSGWDDLRIIDLDDHPPTAYADYVLYGTVESGFKGRRLSTYWAKQVEHQDPQPTTCQPRT